MWEGVHDTGGSAEYGSMGGSTGYGRECGVRREYVSMGGKGACQLSRSSCSCGSPCRVPDPLLGEVLALSVFSGRLVPVSRAQRAG